MFHFEWFRGSPKSPDYNNRVLMVLLGLPLKGGTCIAECIAQMINKIVRIAKCS